MSAPREWPDPFPPAVPPVPAYKQLRRKLDEGETHAEYVREIRLRLAAKETQNQVTGWLLSEGLDEGTVTWLLVWATSDETDPHRPVLHPGLVIGTEDHVPAPARHGMTPYREACGRVYTDPIGSARARAGARADRVSASGLEVYDVPAPEFVFAKPADANEAWDTQHVYDQGTVVRVMILLVIIVIVFLLGLMALLLV